MAWLRAAAVTTRSVGYAQPEFTGQHDLIVQGDDVVLMPRHTRGHWWLAVYWPQTNKLCLWNSLNSTRTTPHTRRDVAVLTEGITSVFGEAPQVEEVLTCPQQTDGHSCGVWTARFAAEAAGVPVVWDRRSMITDLFPELTSDSTTEAEPL
jgi:hypothetical protein